MSGQRNALVIGATGGIGWTIAGALRDDCARITVTSRVPSRAVECAADLQRDKGARYRGVGCDVVEGSSIRRCVAEAARGGDLHVVVVASGRLVLGPLEDLEDEIWIAAVQANLLGPCMVTSAVVPHLRRSGSGRLIIIGSASGVTGLVGRGPYAASKAGLAGLARVAAAELGPSGGTANVVAPGPVATAMVAVAESVPGYRANLERQIPAGRYGRSEEIAAFVAFLASEQSAYVNGQVLVADGGWTATHTASPTPVIP